MQVVPLSAVANQTLTVSLGGQTCQLNVYEKVRYTGVNAALEWSSYSLLYMDVYVSNTLVVGGVVARNAVRIVRDAYFGFLGDFLFVDTQGILDPQVAGLGTRWLLLYFDTTDILVPSV